MLSKHSLIFSLRYNIIFICHIRPTVYQLSVLKSKFISNSSNRILLKKCLNNFPLVMRSAKRLSGNKIEFLVTQEMRSRRNKSYVLLKVICRCISIKKRKNRPFDVLPFNVTRPQLVNCQIETWMILLTCAERALSKFLFFRLTDFWRTILAIGLGQPVLRNIFIKAVKDCTQVLLLRSHHKRQGLQCIPCIPRPHGTEYFSP